MKTLDEVIKALERCMADDAIESEGFYLATDALHYLKVLKDILDPLKVKKNSHEITCPQCNSVIAILLPESNEPLTWDELCTMEGKPIWVEFFYEDGQRFDSDWFLVGSVSGSFCDVIGILGTSRLVKNDYWQAYRKERE